MTDELISVIVPVYNVAPYLDRCVKSIVDQTYKNLEIILVDDGSTDASGDMCDSWAKRGSRIQVIHKPNGGQSEARNVGIDRSTGDYLGFADPDDWLDISMLEMLYTAIRNNRGVDMAVCGLTLVYDDEPKKGQYHETGRIYTLTSDEAVYDVLHYHRPVSTASVCNKLYARHLWDTIRFPIGMHFEDAYIRSRMYVQCEKIAVVDQDLYFYYQREDSTMHTLKLSTQMDGINALIQKCEFLCSHDPHLRPVASVRVIQYIENVYTINSKALSRETDKNLRALFKRYKKGTWEHLNLRDKLAYVLFSISPALMLTAIRIRDVKKHISVRRKG